MCPGHLLKKWQQEEAIRVQMDQELEEAYQEVEDKLFTAVKSAVSRGSKALLGTYLNTLLSYPDRPFDNESLAYPNWVEVTNTFL
jgi:hypothetical protein